MRYSIMLQVVGITTLILIGAAALFAWLQSRPAPSPANAQSNVETLRSRRLASL